MKQHIASIEQEPGFGINAFWGGEDTRHKIARAVRKASIWVSLGCCGGKAFWSEMPLLGKAAWDASPQRLGRLILLLCSSTSLSIILYHFPNPSVPG